MECKRQCDDGCKLLEHGWVSSCLFDHLRLWHGRRRACRSTGLAQFSPTIALLMTLASLRLLLSVPCELAAMCSVRQRRFWHLREGSWSLRRRCLPKTYVNSQTPGRRGFP